jgi:hypothetical protein
LRFISKSLRRTPRTPHVSKFARLELGTFYKAIGKSTFYEFVKFSIEESQIQFFAQCMRYGFKDKSDVVRTALDRQSTELAQKRFRESAAMYSEVYEEDDETQEWTDSALLEWPT